MKRGDKVRVFQDPITREKLEGLATVKRIISQPIRGRGDTQYTAEVHFDSDEDDATYSRFVDSRDVL